MSSKFLRDDKGRNMESVNEESGCRSGPLKGIRVIELAVWHNGGGAGYMLGDLGADVIKIEQPIVGDPSRGVTQAFGHNLELPGGRALWFEMVNRGKRAITLDLKSEQGKEVLRRLISKADVFFTNFTSDVVERLGVDYETLSAINPRLIWAINTAYGTQGPLANKHGYDSSIQAHTGYAYRMGNAEGGEPIIVGGGTFDQMGATMLVYGIMAALIAREKQGVGQAVEASMLGSSIHLQHDNFHMYLWKNDSTFGTSSRSSLDPFVNWYRCADGKWIMLNEPHPERVWEEFCSTMGLDRYVEDPRFATLADRLENAAAFRDILIETFGSRSRKEWSDFFTEKKVRFVYTLVKTVAESAADPQVVANAYVVDTEHPTMGVTKTTGPPIKFSKTPAEVGGAAPEFGQHTEEVLTEVCGYDWVEVEALRESGAI